MLWQYTISIGNELAELRMSPVGYITENMERTLKIYLLIDVVYILQRVQLWSETALSFVSIHKQNIFHMFYNIKCKRIMYFFHRLNLYKYKTLVILINKIGFQSCIITVFRVSQWISICYHFYHSLCNSRYCTAHDSYVDNIQSVWVTSYAS